MTFRATCPPPFVLAFMFSAAAAGGALLGLSRSLGLSYGLMWMLGQLDSSLCFHSPHMAAALGSAPASLGDSATPSSGRGPPVGRSASEPTARGSSGGPEISSAGSSDGPSGCSVSANCHWLPSFVWRWRSGFRGSRFRMSLGVAEVVRLGPAGEPLVVRGGNRLNDCGAPVVQGSRYKSGQSCI